MKKNRGLKKGGSSKINFFFVIFLLLLTFSSAGLSPELEKDETLPYKILWTLNLETTLSPSFITFDEKNIIFREEQKLISGDDKTASRRWEREGDFNNLKFLSSKGGFIYLAYADGYLETIDNENGLLRWKKKLEEPFKFAPQIKGKNLYLASENFLYYFDYPTGRFFWKHKFHQSIQGFYLMPKNVAVVLKNGGIKFIDLKDGLASSSFQLKEEIVAPVFSSTAEFYLISSQNRLICFSLKENKIKWVFPLSTSVPIMLFTQSKIFLAENKMIKVLQRKDGFELWNYELGKEIVSPLKFYKKGIVFITADGSVTYLNTITQELSWQYEIKEDINFAFAKGNLFIVYAPKDKSLSAVDLHDH